MNADKKTNKEMYHVLNLEDHSKSVIILCDQITSLYSNENIIFLSIYPIFKVYFETYPFKNFKIKAYAFIM